MLTVLMMFYILPTILCFVCFYIFLQLEPTKPTNGEVLMIVGTSFVPILNLVVLYLLIVEGIFETDVIEDWMNKKAFTKQESDDE